MKILMMKVTFFMLAMTLSCAGAEITVKDELKGSAPRTILLSDLENRVLDFNPFVVKNFSDALCFEFSSRGYTIKRTASAGAKASELLIAEGADLLITGSIFEGRFGDAIEDRTSTAVQLSLYAKNGNNEGSCRIITDETLTDARVIRRLASKLADAIHDSVRLRK